MCLKHIVCFSELFPLITGPGRAHTGPCGPICAHMGLMGPYGPEKSPKICDKFPLIESFKGPIAMP